MPLMLTAFTARGIALALQLASSLGEGEVWVPERFAQEGLGTYSSLSRWTEVQFAQGNPIIFVSATGIAVRSIAPFLGDKLTDPAVVSVDEGGRFAIPLLSGHVGGANRLARRIGKAIGAVPAISTATDVNGLFAVDEWAARQGFFVTDRTAAKRLSAALLAGQDISFTSEFPHTALPKHVKPGQEPPCFAVTCRRADRFSPGTLVLHPRWLTVGIGCRRGLPPERVGETVRALLAEHGLAEESVGCVASVELKRGDPGILRLAEEWGVPACFYRPEELMAAPGAFASSPFVYQTTGTDNVCERSAVLAAEGGALLVGKTAGNGVTVAVAQRSETVSFEQEEP